MISLMVLSASRASSGPYPSESSSISSTKRCRSIGDIPMSSRSSISLTVARTFSRSLSGGRSADPGATSDRTICWTLRLECDHASSLAALSLARRAGRFLTVLGVPPRGASPPRRHLQRLRLPRRASPKGSLCNRLFKFGRPRRPVPMHQTAEPARLRRRARGIQHRCARPVDQLLHSDGELPPDIRVRG